MKVEYTREKLVAGLIIASLCLGMLYVPDRVVKDGEGYAVTAVSISLGSISFSNCDFPRAVYVHSENSSYLSENGTLFSHDK